MLHKVFKAFLARLFLRIFLKNIKTKIFLNSKLSSLNIEWALHLKKSLKLLHPFMLCSMLGWNRTSASGEDENVKVYNANTDDNDNEKQRTNLDHKSSLEPSAQEYLKRGLSKELNLQWDNIFDHRCFIWFQHKCDN